MSRHKITAFATYPPFCVVCGFGLIKSDDSIDEKASPLEVHHIDDNPKNNIGSNLVFLCGKCHRLQGLGLILNPEIKKNRKKMIIEYKKSGMLFQKYRKKLADDDQKRWFEKKDWKGNWKYTHKDGHQKALATINQRKKEKKKTGHSTKNPNRVTGAKRAWTLMRTRKWKNAHKDSKITKSLKRRSKG